MNSKFGTIKNPLTIIAIFAGTAEVSGTAILPFLQSQNQTLYVWFLMIFPLAIVIFFFMTLNWNYKVLYAPSDFTNEDNFVDILQKASQREVRNKINNEVVEFTESVQDVGVPISSETPLPAEINGNFDEAILIINNTEKKTSLNDVVDVLGLSKDEITPKEIREVRSQVMQKIQRKVMDEIKLAEKLAVEKLEKELGVSIETEIKLSFGQSGVFYFDGVIRQNNKVTAVEVKYFRDPNMNSFGFMRNITEQLKRISFTLSGEQKEDFSLILVLVTDFIDEKVLSRINNEMKKLPFPVVIKYYEFDALVNEFLH